MHYLSSDPVFFNDDQFIKIQISQTGRIVGATIEKYLLEKTRIVHHLDGERSFHIFYQIVHGAPDDLKKHLSISGDIGKYKMLLPVRPNSRSPIDSNDFKLTCACLCSVGIDQSQQLNIFSMIGGILHLSNVEFEEDSERGTAVLKSASSSSLANVSLLFGLTEIDLLNTMTTQTMVVNGQNIVKQYSTVQTFERKESIMKTVYSLLFDWLIKKVNDMICYTSATPGMLWKYAFASIATLFLPTLRINRFHWSAGYIWI